MTVRFIVSIPATYPEASPPQLQLLSKYVGDFLVDSSLFGSILRLYLSSEGVKWSAGQICVFDGLESAASKCSDWYGLRLSEKSAAAMQRMDGLGLRQPYQMEEESSQNTMEIPLTESDVPDPISSLLPGVVIHEASPIQDRRSVFVGRACRLTHPDEVAPILAHLMSDHRIARAAHPIINAWRVKVDDVIHADNDDDGETAAGGRLAHLLQILGVDGVLVVVTRYFGGIHLGPDRFKHVNQAARDALEAGGFLDVQDTHKDLGPREKKRMQTRGKHGN